MQGRLVGLKSAPLPSLISNDSVPACVKVGHALICNPRSSSPVSFQSRNLDYFPSAPATPQSILYAEKHPNSLTATQLLLSVLAPFSWLYTFTPICHIPGTFSQGTSACTGTFSLHPQSCICASRIKWSRVCRVQSADRWRDQTSFQNHLRIC